MSKTLDVINIKGKNYVQVHTRVKAFREMYKNGSIQTEILSHDDGIIVMKASVYVDEKLIATGTASENQNDTRSMVNKTSYVENCETSAIGRALGIAGIGIDASIASANEVESAIEEQNNIENTPKNSLHGDNNAQPYSPQ